MNQNLQSRFAAELKGFWDEGIAGDAVIKYLLDKRNEVLRIPNAVYCLLQMLGYQHEKSDVLYVEYSGLCVIHGCLECPTMTEAELKLEFQWLFWYTEQKEALNLTAVPEHSISKIEGQRIVDSGENDIKFKIYAKLAYQCMAIYDTGYECYLPKACFRMVKYVLFLCSYKAFLAALKTAVKHRDVEVNYAIKEVLETVLGLKGTFDKELYPTISRMRGTEKAVVSRVIASWKYNNELRSGLNDMINEFERGIRKPENRRWIEDHEQGVRSVLGEELFYQMQVFYKEQHDDLLK